MRNFGVTATLVADVGLMVTSGLKVGAWRAFGRRELSDDHTYGPPINRPPRPRSRSAPIDSIMEAK